MIRSLLFALILVLVLLGITRTRGWTRRHVRPSGPKDFAITLLGLIAATVWFGQRGIMERLGWAQTIPDPGYIRYVALAFAVVTALVAVGKRRNLAAWFAGGLWFMLLALLALVFLPTLQDALCPACHKGVSAQASICPHCRKRLVETRA